MRARRGGLAGLLLVVLVGTGLAAAARPGRADSYGAIALYAEAMSLIHDDYVEELSWPKIVRASIRGAVQGLDGDSTVLEADAPPRAGSAAAAGDVGLALTRRDGGLVVVAAPAGLPAQGAGIQSGDRILTLDGEAVAAAPPDAVARRLRGRPGSQVALTVIRSRWAEPRAFALTRVAPPAAVPAERQLSDGVLYVRIPAVDEAGAASLARLLAAAPGARGLVLDLRDTAGGRIEAVPAIASLFLDPGSVIARVESRAAGSPTVLTATTASIRWTGPVAVLVDRGTASAAEVLAGAMQDTRRAVIVGAPTFGDATTQSAIPLSDHSTLSLTTARYLTPGRHPITGHGIAPDVSAPVPSPRAVGGADAELELAFQVVKAAGILQNGAGVSAGGEEARG